MKRSESIDQIAAALAAAQGEMEEAPKDSTNPHFKSHYANLASVIGASRQALAKHGLALVQFPFMENGRVVIETLITHKSGQWIEGEPLALKPQQDTPQAIGSCITYGRRYTHGSAVGVVPSEDDDGNAASIGGQGKQQQKGQQGQHQQKAMAKAKEAVKEAEQKAMPFDKFNEGNLEKIAELLNQQKVEVIFHDDIINEMHGKEFRGSVLNSIIQSVKQRALAEAMGQ